MTLICDLVQKALKTGYLTLEAEEQLRVCWRPAMSWKILMLS
jgi:hypothetical protein